MNEKKLVEFLFHDIRPLFWLNRKHMNLKHIYITIKKNEICGLNIENGATQTERAEFSSKRLLVGSFTIAENTLELIAHKILAPKRWWYKPPLKVVIHPLEMNEGGLSEVEERATRELALAAFLGFNVQKVIIWNGKILTAEQVIKCSD